MKIKFFILLMAMMALVCSCDHEPTYHKAYIENAEINKEITETLKGQYVGTLRIGSYDGNPEPIKNDEGQWVHSLEMDSVSAFTILVGGYENQYVTYVDFPISWVAKSIPDTEKELKEAVAKLPNTSIIGEYKVKGDAFNQEDHSGYLSITIQPVVLKMEMDGKEHIVEFHFRNALHLIINADERETWDVTRMLQMDLSYMMLDGETKGNFSMWDSGYWEFNVWYRHMNKVMNE